jgi:hypothetical protein
MSLRTILLDADNNQSNRRTIFRLPEGIYPSNLKLLNVGCITVDATARLYNELAGTTALIRQIQLLDGAVVLDSLDRANIWNAFKSYNKSNDNNRDLQKNLRKNNMGFTLTPETLQITPYYTPTEAQQTEDATAKSWMDLSDMFSFLKQIKYIDTQMFPNFRVVIEYEQDKDVWLSGAAVQGKDTVEPLVVAEEINDPEFRNSVWSDFKGMNYVSYEVDTVRLNAVLPTALDLQKQQNETFRFNGFNGKIVNRCLLAKNALTEENNRASAIYNTLGSEAQNSQVFQLRVNGSQVFPRSGIIDNNQRLAILHDTWGSLNTIPSAGSLPFEDSVNYVVNDTDRLGHLDYMGCNLGYRIEDLQLDYERKGAYDGTLANQAIGQYNQSLQFNLFGEIMKRLVFANGKYIISYM